MSAHEITLGDLLQFLCDRIAGKPTKYSDANGLHCHRCPEPACGCVWQHPTPPASLSDECHDKWHSCPRCGADQHYKEELSKVGHIDVPWRGGNG